MTTFQTTQFQTNSTIFLSMHVILVNSRIFYCKLIQFQEKPEITVLMDLFTMDFDLIAQHSMLRTVAYVTPLSISYSVFLTLFASSGMCLTLLMLFSITCVYMYI
jgi:hypothetical protein